MTGSLQFQVCVSKRDIQDFNDDEERTDIATAPQFVAAPIRTIGELERDIDASNGGLNQLQIASIPDLDLTLLIKKALHPFNLLEEADQAWEW
jgi:Intraflagellar transport protein 43